MAIVLSTTYFLAASLGILASNATVQGSIEDYVDKHFPWGAGNTTVELLNPLSHLSGSEEFTINSFRPNRYLGQLRFEIQWGKNPAQRAWIPVRVQIQDSVPIAIKTLRAGQKISEEDIVIKTMSFDQPVRHKSIKELIGQHTRKRIAAGSPIRNIDLKEQHAIRSGQQVVLELTQGKLRIRDTAKALGSGTIGEMIQVRSSSTHRVLRARITANGVVEFGTPRGFRPCPSH